MEPVYTIKEKEITAGSLTSVGPRSIQNGQIVTWDILVSGVDPDDVSEQQVIEDTVDDWVPNGLIYSIPKLNEDVLTMYDSSGGVGIYAVQPWLYCSAKRCQRDRGNRLLFHLSAEYSTGSRRSLEESQLYSMQAPTTSDELPFLRENVYSQDEVILWEEANKSPGEQKLKLRLPTGNQFSEPFVAKVPKRTIRQTQFEEIADDATLHTLIQDRLFSLPTTNWPTSHSSRPEQIPPRWMIVAIDYQKTRIKRLGGGYLSGYMMSYTIDYKTPTRSDKDGGFWDRRALIDNYELLTPNDVNSRAAVFDPNGGNAIIVINLNEDGTRRDPTLEPVYKDFKVQPEISWSFLRL